MLIEQNFQQQLIIIHTRTNLFDWNAPFSSKMIYFMMCVHAMQPQPNIKRTKNEFNELMLNGIS